MPELVETHPAEGSGIILWYRVIVPRDSRGHYLITPHNEQNFTDEVQAVKLGRLVFFKNEGCVVVRGELVRGKTLLGGFHYCSFKGFLF